MNNHKWQWAIGAAMLGSILLPVRVSSQMPSLAKLIVRSTPKGAAIFVNGRATSQFTDAQFVVAPGHYVVSVSGGATGANCGEQAVDVGTGGTRNMTCSQDRWAVQ